MTQSMDKIDGIAKYMTFSNFNAELEVKPIKNLHSARMSGKI